MAQMTYQRVPSAELGRAPRIGRAPTAGTEFPEVHVGSRPVGIPWAVPTSCGRSPPRIAGFVVRLSQRYASDLRGRVHRIRRWPW